MTLLDYLKDAKETVAAFAARIDEAENTIKKIAYGQRQPSLALAVKISEATDGQVTAADMVLPNPPEDNTGGAPAKAEAA